MSFAAFALQHMPQLAVRLAGSDVEGWLEAQDFVDVDGERFWIVDGDRLIDAAEAKLRWAREHGLVDDARLAALQAEYHHDDPDTETIEPGG
ncbi:hypothetical protein DMC47_42945 [Nostoc sp. 3335mG]|nr:hypothetical protein DMC47_42945 [Nostoc sp. 3335mG]